MHEKNQRIVEKSTLDLMDHLADLEKHGLTYIREYVDSFLATPHGGRRPAARMHPKLAELCRELVSENALFERRGI